MREPLANIGMTCPEHSSKPNKDLVKSAKENPNNFVGKFVKKGFAATIPGGKKSTEHMWVKVTGVEDGKLIGVLDNDPICVDDKRVVYGCRVAVSPEEIEDLAG